MELDLVIRNGAIVDGSGSARFTADIGIQNGPSSDEVHNAVNIETELEADENFVFGEMILMLECCTMK